MPSRRRPRATASASGTSSSTTSTRTPRDARRTAACGPCERGAARRSSGPVPVAVGTAYPSSVRAPSLTELRRGALAVSVLHDIDVEPAPLGVTLTGAPPVWVSWGECRDGAGRRGPRVTRRAGPPGRLGASPAAGRPTPDRRRSRPALRPVGLPVDHALHPGPAWVQERVLGGALDLGLGAVGLDPARPRPGGAAPAPGARGGRARPAGRLDAVRARLEELGALAAERVRLDPKGQLRPFGDADAVTLLGARALRDGAGARRRRAGRRRRADAPARLDAARAHRPGLRARRRGREPGRRPRLRRGRCCVTADEVTLVPEGGNPSAAGPARRRRRAPGRR